MLGSPGGGLPTGAGPRAAAIPTIAEVLELARLTGAKVNLEIKNVPTDPDCDPTPAYANRVMDVVLAAGLPRSQLLIQSFIPANLDVAKQRLPRVPTSLLTSTPIRTASSSRATAATTGSRRSGRSRPPSCATPTALRRLVAPYTLNERAQVRAAGRARRDAVITDDPMMAGRALGLRPVRALRVTPEPQGGSVEADGRLVPPRRRRAPQGLQRRRDAAGAGREAHPARRHARLRRDCLVELKVPVPRGAPARPDRHGRLRRQRPAAAAPGRPAAGPPEIPLAVPHRAEQRPEPATGAGSDLAAGVAWRLRLGRPRVGPHGRLGAPG